MYSSHLKNSFGSSSHYFPSCSSWRNIITCGARAGQYIIIIVLVFLVLLVKNFRKSFNSHVEHLYQFQTIMLLHMPNNFWHFSVNLFSCYSSLTYFSLLLLLLQPEHIKLAFFYICAAVPWGTLFPSCYY